MTACRSARSAALLVGSTPLDAHEDPQRWLDRQQLPTYPGGLGAAAGGARLQLLADHRAHHPHVLPEGRTLQRAIAHTVPPSKHVLGTAQQLLADLAARMPDPPLPENRE